MSRRSRRHARGPVWRRVAPVMVAILAGVGSFATFAQGLTSLPTPIQLGWALLRGLLR
jgi:hypothetical protein